MKISDEHLEALAASEVANDMGRFIASELLVARRVVEQYRKLDSEFTSYVSDIRGDWSGFDGRDLSKKWTAVSLPMDELLAAYDAAVNQTLQESQRE